MILILSANQETTTNEVIKWLKALGKPFIRIHEDEIFEITAHQNRIFLQSQRNSFYIEDISSVWYRRGGLQFRRKEYKNPSINAHMNETQYWLEDYVIKMLEMKKHINKQSNSHLNKLLVLEKAKKVDLKVPSYYLAENTEQLIVNKTITKSIAENIILKSVGGFSEGILYTSLVTEKERENFFITFFQEMIEKDFEVRAFYLHGKIWATAIFSQNDKKTQLDHRKYNHEVPNRNVRYNLPREIEEKIHILMQELDINCGSLDLIKAKNDFYFLEINPVGQFLGLSAICNYALEKEIAEYL
ncbi:MULTISPECIES: grasp-with-spasm system ATP-grasp peptide maturase [unclassified Chryseobacterium]|uniref:grasp-with-spasm system ATP-grasp peptide maturase n=1 Tax=unclassified Chryseobacterium TaxID=2593645 RepID=UPI000D715087|nr:MULTISPECIES: grasp-with-spasm system ATP-grasp peptide maturase [unclassified Chryseobacterium]PWW19536.1 ATP-GRASP peptide maturase of grasp-with-spasm system [Chryseobacterium sp. AG844]